MWICGDCGRKHEDMDLVQCIACGWSRKFNKKDKRLVSPFEEGVVVYPSRRREAPHVVGVTKDRKATCSTCTAAQFGRECWAVKRLTNRIQNPRFTLLRQVVEVKFQVFTVLYRFPDDANSDWRLAWHWLRDWKGVPYGKPIGEFFEEQALLDAEYFLETVRRRRPEWQRRGYFPSSKTVREHRAKNERSYRREYSPRRTTT